MKYFTVAGEDRRLDDAERHNLRGDFIELADGVTHYELRGPAAGQVVVLVPGLTIPLFYWDEFAEELHARGLRTLAFSAYGRGYSDRLTTSYDEALFARQLSELTTALSLAPRQHLVGTSMGAIIALRHLADRADSVASLTLIGPAGLSGATAGRERLLRSDLLAALVAKRFGRRVLLGHLGHNVSDPGRVGQLTEMIAETYRYQGSMYGFFSTLQNVALSNRAALFRAAGQSSVPTLLMWGAQDRVTPITAFDDAQSLLNPAETRVLECGHMAPYERPAEVAEYLAAFLTENRSTP